MLHGVRRLDCRRIDETDQTRPYLGGGVLDDGHVTHMRYVLPDITCGHAVLQMAYRENVLLRFMCT